MKEMKLTQVLTLLCLMVLVSPSIALAQGPPDEPEMGMDANLIRQYSNYITPEDLRSHLSFIASDECEGRETGERGQKLAARYIAAQFQKFGLQPGANGEWYQPYPLVRSTLTDASISIGKKKEFKLLEDFFSFGKSSLTESMSGEFAFAGYGIQAEKYNNYDGLNVKDKVVVALYGEPMREGHYVISGSGMPSDWTTDPREKRNVAAEAGAKALLLVLPQDTYDQFAKSPWIRRITQGASLRPASAGTTAIPVIYLSERMGEAIFKHNKAKPVSLKKELNASAKVPSVNFKKLNFNLSSDGASEEIEAENVLGFLEGTDKKDEVLVITAHYDHLGVRGEKIYNGADDDGSGTVGVLELAESFARAAKEGHRPRRSILFMTVSGEEKGLLGSDYYTRNPIYPLKKTIADLNIDMIGRVDEDHEDEEYVYIIGSDRLSTDLHEISEAANRDFTQLELDYTYNDPEDPNHFYERSDHYNFAEKGIPVIFYFTGVHEDYHKPTDTIEKIMFPKMSKILKLVFATAWDLANREDAPVVDKE